MSYEDDDRLRVRGRRIPLSCPNCTNKLSLEGYKILSQILAPRYWHSCPSCGFKRDVYDFKKELLTV